MRIAFVTNPALGHVLPLLPLALAARDAGHDVVVLGGASIAAGRRACPGCGTSSPVRPTCRRCSRACPSATGSRAAGCAAVTWQRAFAGILAPELAAATLELARDWPPDLVIHEDSEQGSWIAAERLGIPHLAFQATAWRGTGLRLSSEPLNALRASLGLAADPGLERWHRHGYLGTRPPSLHNPDDPPPATTVPVRPVALDDVAGPGPGVGRRTTGGPAEGRPHAGHDAAGPHGRLGGLLDGLATLDAEVVATVGQELDPAERG